MSDQVGNPGDRFCCNAAHICLSVLFQTVDGVGYGFPSSQRKKTDCVICSVFNHGDHYHYHYFDICVLNKCWYAVCKDEINKYLPVCIISDSWRRRIWISVSPGTEQKRDCDMCSVFNYGGRYLFYYHVHSYVII